MTPLSITGVITRALLLLSEWLTAPKYDDIGYTVGKLGTVSSVMITQGPARPRYTTASGHIKSI